MTFEMSPHIAVRTDRFAEAVDFYATVLGSASRSDDPELADFEAGPINLLVLEDQAFRGPVLAPFGDDLAAAQQRLVAAGRIVRRRRGRGEDCYIEAPSGVIYNLPPGGIKPAGRKGAVS